jgi:FKBP-type peptidyl-prolyl cis-trans isomerase 2
MIDKLKPKPGMILSLKTEKDGHELMVPATVIRATDSEVEVDYNHPLAGHHLPYIVTIIALTLAGRNASYPAALLKPYKRE